MAHYIANLLRGLPPCNEWVFSSPTSESGHIEEKEKIHRKACAAVGIEGITLHGLRRTNATVTVWLENITTGLLLRSRGNDQWYA